MSVCIDCIVYVAGSDDHHSTFQVAQRDATDMWPLHPRDDNDFFTRFPLAAAWTKVKNLAAPAVRRGAEEEWGR